MIQTKHERDWFLGHSHLVLLNRRGFLKISLSFNFIPFYQKNPGLAKNELAFSRFKRNDWKGMVKYCSWLLMTNITCSRLTFTTSHWTRFSRKISSSYSLLSSSSVLFILSWMAISHMLDTITKDDHKCSYNLERHSRVVNYAPRGSIYTPGVLFMMFIIKATN